MNKSPKNKDRRQILREYLEGELTPQEKAYVEQQIHDSEEWREERQRMENYLSTLNHLPLLEPLPDLWNSIEQKINQSEPKSVWFRWWYAYPRFTMASRFALIFVVLLTSSWFLFDNSMTEPGYRIMTVEEVNGFGVEAETYAAVHEMNGSVPSDSEALISLYTSGWPK